MSPNKTHLTDKFGGVVGSIRELREMWDPWWLESTGHRMPKRQAKRAFHSRPPTSNRKQKGHGRQ